MIVKVSCSCGRITRLDAARAGKRVRCPGCDRVLTVPAASTAEEAADPYAVAGLSSAGREVAPPRAKKPPCFFCGTRKKVTRFQVWTGTKGEQIEVRLANDEIGLGPSYEDLVGHEVFSCKPCARKLCRRYRKWLLWTALGQLVVSLVITAGLVLIAVFTQTKIESQKFFFTAVFTDVVALCGFLGALCSYFFGGTTFAATEKAIAALTHKDLDPDANVGLSSVQKKELQPQQIIGSPRWADGREEDDYGR